jgi:hypothetical protein
MPEEQKQEYTSLPAEPRYYKNTASKVTDFLMGFLGYPMIMFFAQMAFGPEIPMRGSSLAGVGTALVSLALTVFFVVFAYKRGRKFIAIGILSLVIVPLIAFGSCLLVILAVSRH